MKGEKRSITVRLYRSAQGEHEAGFQEYVVASDAPQSVMNLLALIREEDPTVACRTSVCFKGLCGSCLMRVNGKEALGCVTLVSPGETVAVEPHSGFQAVRDVVVDFAAPLAGNRERGE